MSFYYPDQNDADAYALLINALVSLGATLTGEVFVHNGSAIRTKPFVRLSDSNSQRHFVSLIELQSLLIDSDTRVIETYMRNAIGIAKESAEIITYVSHENELSALVDHHPLVIWTEGMLFEGHQDERDRIHAIKAGETVYHRFRDVVLSTNPAYATISSECAILCPTDLSIQSDSYAFSNCYLSNHCLDACSISHLLSCFQDIYFEHYANGVYCSGCQFFNPAQKKLSVDRVYKFSCEVSKLIGKRGKERQEKEIS